MLRGFNFFVHTGRYRQHKLIKSEWIAIHYCIMEDIADRVGLEYYLIVRCEFISMCTPQIVGIILYIYNVNKKKIEKCSCEVYQYHTRNVILSVSPAFEKLSITSWMGVFFFIVNLNAITKYSIKMLHI